jgi:ribosome-associated translation inhibitor RaiA
VLIHMRTQNLDMVGAIHRHLERRVRAALGSSATQLRSVSLGLSDVNGPRGGADLRCVITAELIPRGLVRAEATSSDLLSAVGRALARVRRSLRQGASRRRRVRTEESAEPARVAERPSVAQLSRGVSYE